MHYTRDYTNSPAKAFDAVQDSKDWLGERWETVLIVLRRANTQEQFRLMCDIAGIRGYPVVALYEHIHGEGSWKDEE